MLRLPRTINATISRSYKAYQKQLGIITGKGYAVREPVTYKEFEQRYVEKYQAGDKLSGFSKTLATETEVTGQGKLGELVDWLLGKHEEQEFDTEEQRKEWQDTAVGGLSVTRNQDGTVNKASLQFALRTMSGQEFGKYVGRLIDDGIFDNHQDFESFFY